MCVVSVDGDDFSPCLNRFSSTSFCMQLVELCNNWLCLSFIRHWSPRITSFGYFTDNFTALLYSPFNAIYLLTLTDDAHRNNNRQRRWMMATDVITILLTPPLTCGVATCLTLFHMLREEETQKKRERSVITSSTSFTIYERRDSWRRLGKKKKKMQANEMDLAEYLCALGVSFKLWGFISFTVVSQSWESISDKRTT